MRSTNSKSPKTPDSPEAPTRTRRRRTLGALVGAVLIATVLAGCQVPVEQWVPDFNGDGVRTQDEIDHQSAEILNAVAANVDAQRRSVQQHPFLTCIRHHESDRGPWPHTNGYSAENPSSTASGAYQFLDSTWRKVSAQAGHPGYARAKYAPWYVQDAVILWVYEHGGRRHWAGSGC
jgi:hypothetical protein